MSRKKLKRFAELPFMSNVALDPVRLRGQWRSAHFHNDHPLTVELACGRGDFTLALAEREPRRNFVGVDIKGARLWQGATLARERGLTNVAFCRALVEHLCDCFADGEVDEIWITFPEPHPKRSKARKRLTAPRFLAAYRRVLRPGGRVHLKTDDTGLLEFTLETLRAGQCTIVSANTDVHATPPADELLALKTTYESRFLEEGRKIKYLCFRF